MATVRFSVLAESIPAQNPTVNNAGISYSYTPVEGGIPGEFEVTSNEVPVLVEGMLADVSVVKTASGSVRPGEALTYTVTVSNAGPSEAENVVLTGSRFPEALRVWNFLRTAGLYSIPGPEA